MRYQHDHDFAPVPDVTDREVSLLTKFISGGQAGAERAVLDWAIENQVEYGGWCPQGRRAEDGEISAEYALLETRTRNYAEAIEQNTRHSDATLIVTIGRKLDGALKHTIEVARRAHKPYLHLSKNLLLSDNAQQLRDFIQDKKVSSLHVTGTRASEESGIEEFVSALLTEFAKTE
ncbi:putative molybdenum carrier protein [Verrucomicrobiota bacterium sgz303538]